MFKGWVITTVLTGLWLAVASANAYYNSSTFIRKNRREGSSVPIIGAVFATLAVYTCPWLSPLKWAALVLMLPFDPGSLRWAALLVMAVVMPERLRAFNKGRAERVRRILEASPGGDHREP